MSRPNLIPGHSSNIWFNARGAPRVSRDQWSVTMLRGA